jgi:hypothetical protein
MPRSFLIALLALSSPALLHAQANSADIVVRPAYRSFFYRNTEPPPVNAADSLAFVAFVAAVEQEPQRDTAAAPPADYKLVWYEQREGWQYVLLPGDGSTLKDHWTLDDARSSSHFRFSDIPVLTFRGDRYASIDEMPNTGLIRYRHYYFERRSPPAAVPSEAR